MTIDKIQQIISYAYPLIQKYYGKGKLPIPKIDTSHKNTYAMHSGEPEAQGEHDATSIAEYYEGTIYLYLPNIVNEEELLRSIIHEYTHYTQDSELLKRYKQMYSYDEDPTEIEARKNEENWEMFSQK
tara:strand:+ start:1698 stop:2081 length:384 start_codon:yes stop_codon:yes gene_type:complete